MTARFFMFKRDFFRAENSGMNENNDFIFMNKKENKKRTVFAKTYQNNKLVYARN